MTANMSSLLSTTTNMSSVALRSMLSMPTRFLNHIRRVDDLLAFDIHSQHAAAEQGQHPSPFVVNLPGPWAFITSGYAISLLAMVSIRRLRRSRPHNAPQALLLNRIQHIVVPPRHSLIRHLTRHYAHARTRQSIFRLVISSLFPLNLTSTLSRFVLRS